MGFRLVAFALGGLETSVQMFGCQLRIAPMGSLATAITFTLFYIAMLMIWKARFKKEYGLLAYGGFVLAILRFLIMACPANNWNSLEVPQDWSIYRNVPLMLMQLIVAFLFMRDAIARKDTLFIRISALISGIVCLLRAAVLPQRTRTLDRDAHKSENYSLPGHCVDCPEKYVSKKNNRGTVERFKVEIASRSLS